MLIGMVCARARTRFDERLGDADGGDTPVEKAA
jgi:hypothetical protein